MAQTFSTRLYDFSGFADTGLFICHVSRPDSIGIFRASIIKKEVKSIDFVCIRGLFLDYASEMTLFLNRLNSFLYKGENVCTLNLSSVQNDEDTYHDEQLVF